MVYKYCYSNSYLTKVYVEESVTDIMKHPVCTSCIISTHDVKFAQVVERWTSFRRRGGGFPLRRIFSQVINRFLCLPLCASAVMLSILYSVSPDLMSSLYTYTLTKMSQTVMSGVASEA